MSNRTALCVRGPLCHHKSNQPSQRSTPMSSSDTTHLVSSFRRSTLIPFRIGCYYRRTAPYRSLGTHPTPSCLHQSSRSVSTGKSFVCCLRFPQSIERPKLDLELPGSLSDQSSCGSHQRRKHMQLQSLGIGERHFSYLSCCDPPQWQGFWPIPAPSFRSAPPGPRY